jgi:transglutaminase-like putative cysteine protease
MTNHRLTITAAIAVFAAALSLYSVLQGNGWMAASIGAIVVVAGAGTLTRLATIPAAIVATAAVLLAFAGPLAGKGWFGLVAALVVVALAAVSATGSRLPRAFAALATYAALLLLYLNVVFAHSKSLGGIIPTKASLAALSHMPSQASNLFRYSPPIQPNRSVELFAAAGIGVVAILVDLLAVRLRRPAIAGLPLLLLFSVPVASSLKGFGLYQTITFGLGIAAYLALLSTDGRQRLRMWGRLVTIRRISVVDENNAAPDTREMAASGRRVGLAAVAVAMAVPVVLVGSSPHDLFKHSVGDGLGISIGASSVSPLLSISAQLSEAKPKPVLTYSTTAADPGLQYFQEYVLTYDAHDNGWPEVNGHQKAVDSPALPYPIPGLNPVTPVTKVTTTVTVGSFVGGTDLPLPYAPTKISDQQHLLLTEVSGSLMVIGDEGLDDAHYTVDSTEPDPSTTVLNANLSEPGSLLKEYASYNGPDQATLGSMAGDITSGAQTQLQQADELQHWFDSGRFTYTTSPRFPSSQHWLLAFLTKDKRGDCEQFAPAFAILARLLGIPARVVVGYTGGTPDGNGNWLVTTADAHAWPELYFPKVGWIRFEPTPNARGDQGTATLPSYTQAKFSGGTAGHGSTPTAPPSTGTSGKPKTSIGTRIHNPGQTTGGGSSGGGGTGFPVGLGIALAVLLLLAWPAAGRWLTGRRRWLTASTDAGLAHAAWLELSDYLSDYALVGLPSESPRATAARVAAAVGSPAAAGAVTRIGAAEERARYAVAPAPGTGLRADVETTRKAVAENCTWSRRLRARLLPASTLTKVLGGVQSANRALSWIDSPLPSLRHRTAGRSASET